jgi:hypothetical protein
VKIKYLPASPKFPLEEHVRNDVGATLVAAGFAELIPPARRGSREWLADLLADQAAATPAAIVTWGIHRGRDTNRPAIVGRCSLEVCGSVRFEAKPEDAHRTTFHHSHGAAAPEKVPDAVVKAYAAAVKEDQGIVTGDESAYFQSAHHKGDSGTHAKINQGIGRDGKPILVDVWW